MFLLLPFYLGYIYCKYSCFFVGGAILKRNKNAARDTAAGRKSVKERVGVFCVNLCQDCGELDCKGGNSRCGRIRGVLRGGCDQV